MTRANSMETKLNRRKSVKKPFKRLCYQFILPCLCITLSACTAYMGKQALDKGELAYKGGYYSYAAIELQKAAFAGNPEAQYALGYMYFYGKGLPENEEYAKYWIDRAAVQGEPLAVEAATMLENQGKITPVLYSQ